MFYSQLILAKNGPLGTIWIAAHLERKLRRNQVAQTNICVSVDSILFPEAPIALRLSGHLLLGVVRIYAKKVNYLYSDCKGALGKIKQTFHSGVDLPPEASTAPFHAITLPEDFDLNELERLPEHENSWIFGHVEHHVTTREQITLQDPMDENSNYGSHFSLDERFPDAVPCTSVDFEEDFISGKFHSQGRSPGALTLEDVLPAMLEDQTTYYDRVDQMDGMEIDVHNQGPVTPLVPPDLMDTDKGESEHKSKLPEDPDQPEPISEVHHPIKQSIDTEELEPIIEVTGVPALEVPDELVLDIEGPAKLKPLLPTDSFDFEQEVIPEYENLRSAAGPPAEQESDVFGPDKEVRMADEGITETIETRVEAADADQVMEEEQMVDGKMGDMIEEAFSPPVVTTPSKTPNMEELPTADDILATLLGGPAITFMPTPTEETPAQQRTKRAPKPVPRKRKPVLDIAMVLHREVIKEQLANTDNIRRVRIKPPQTCHELWMVQKSQGYQIFCEPSIPGICIELRELYGRMLVHGEAPLPPAEAVQETTPNNGSFLRSQQIATLQEEPIMKEHQTTEPQSEAREAGDEGAPTSSVIPDAGAIPLQPEGEIEVQHLKKVLNKESTTEFDRELQACEEQEAGGSAEELGIISEKERLSTKMKRGAPALLVAISPPSAPIKLDISKATEAEVKRGATTIAVEVASMGVLPWMDENAPELLVLSPGSAPIEQEIPIEAETEVERGTATIADVVPLVDGMPQMGRNPTGGPEVLREVEGEDMKEPEVEENIAVEAEAVGAVAVVPEEDDVVVLAEDKQPKNHAHGFLRESEDTVFLARDDYDLHGKAEGYMGGTAHEPNDSTLQAQFNGWSWRTRAVAQYLLKIFETMEPTDRDGRPSKFGLDHSLRGMSRKAAARMFFETLVLKKKNYIHVEQEQPYQEIYLTATPTLKSCLHGAGGAKYA